MHMNSRFELAKQIILQVFEEYDLELGCVILFGGREQNTIRFDEAVELFVIAGADLTDQMNVQLNTRIKMDLMRTNIWNTVCQVHGLSTWTETIRAGFSDQIGDLDKITATYFGIVLSNGVFLYKNQNVWNTMMREIHFDKEQFLRNCLFFSQYLGAEKWEAIYEKKLYQHIFQTRGEVDKGLSQKIKERKNQRMLYKKNRDKSPK